MIKIILPSKVFPGNILIKYTGNNSILFNSANGHFLKSIYLFEYINVYQGERVRNCFKIELLGEQYIVSFDGSRVYKLDKSDNKYKNEVCSFLTEYELFFNEDLLLIVGELYLHNEISETDERIESYKFTFVLKYKEEIENLFI